MAYLWPEVCWNGQKQVIINHKIIFTQFNRLYNFFVWICHLVTKSSENQEDWTCLINSWFFILKNNISFVLNWKYGWFTRHSNTFLQLLWLKTVFYNSKNVPTWRITATNHNEGIGVFLSLASLSTPLPPWMLFSCVKLSLLMVHRKKKN